MKNETTIPEQINLRVKLDILSFVNGDNVCFQVDKMTREIFQVHTHQIRLRIRKEIKNEIKNRTKIKS